MNLTIDSYIIYFIINFLFFFCRIYTLLVSKARLVKPRKRGRFEPEPEPEFLKIKENSLSVSF